MLTPGKKDAPSSTLGELKGLKAALSTSDTFFGHNYMFVLTAFSLATQKPQMRNSLKSHSIIPEGILLSALSIHQGILKKGDPTFSLNLPTGSKNSCPAVQLAYFPPPHCQPPINNQPRQSSPALSHSHSTPIPSSLSSKHIIKSAPNQA